jgi:hypothetical protein
MRIQGISAMNHRFADRGHRELKYARPMTSFEKLLSISSEALAPPSDAMPPFLANWKHGPELFAMLKQKNGFYAFESALHVFSITADPASGLEGWNSQSLWRGAYKDLAQGLLFFAEDVFQDQFCLSDRGVIRFHAETGETEPLADSVEAWADLILSDYSMQTGWKLAHEWQALHGPLPPGKRLMPKIPFVLGGEYSLGNLWAGNPLEGMSFKADVAKQIRNLPDGTKIRLQVKEYLPVASIRTLLRITSASSGLKRQPAWGDVADPAPLSELASSTFDPTRPYA